MSVVMPPLLIGAELVPVLCSIGPLQDLMHGMDDTRVPLPAPVSVG